jgi:hypothetical protein
MNSDLASDPAYEWSDWTAKQLQTFTLSVEEPLPIRDPKHSHRALLTTSSERIDVLVALEEMGSAINESEIYPTGYENEFEIIRMTPAKWDDMIKLVKSDKLKKLPGNEEPHITPPAEYSEYDDLGIVLYLNRPGKKGTMSPAQIAEALPREFPKPLRIFRMFKDGVRLNTAQIVYENLKHKSHALSYGYMRIHTGKCTVRKFAYKTNSLIPAEHISRRGDARKDSNVNDRDAPRRRTH